ncbi:MAG: photosynthetic complex assembly protein PuhC [Elioraea sp.]|nr:photosynthetic complex assembly protein PuhC [Elioraea sp.]
MARTRFDRLVANPLAVGGAMIAITLAAVLGPGLHQPQDPPRGARIATRDLRFEDRPEGAVAIVDARNGAVVALIPPGEGGFVRATLRGLARERRMNEAGGAEVPFRVSVWEDGRLTLEDTATGRLVDLGAFGQTQVQTFARLVATGRD